MSVAKHEYHLRTCDDGKVEGTSWTNDNLDLGYPSEEASWYVSYPTRRQALERTGGTHVGANGCQVVVYLDGKRVDLAGVVLTEPEAYRRARP